MNKKLKRRPGSPQNGAGLPPGRLPSLNIPSAAPAQAAPEPVEYEEIVDDVAQPAPLATTPTTEDEFFEEDEDGEEDDAEAEDMAVTPVPVGPRPASEVNSSPIPSTTTPTKKVRFKRATQDQAQSGALFRERQDKVTLLQRVANLENENAVLRKNVAELQIVNIQTQINQIGNANQEMFTRAGLKPGDQLTDNLDGRKGEWVVIPGA